MSNWHVEFDEPVKIRILSGPDGDFMLAQGKLQSCGVLEKTLIQAIMGNFYAHEKQGECEGNRYSWSINPDGSVEIVVYYKN